VDLGRVNSKYDCALGANLHPSLPVDRHILAKRIRVWVNADGFISPLDFGCLASFAPGPPAVWHFVANAGDGRTVEIQMTADMLEERNTTVFHFSRPPAEQATGKQLPAQAEVALTVRVDIEDRNFHSETKRNGGTEHHFASNLHPLPEVARALPKPPPQAAANEPQPPEPGVLSRLFRMPFSKAAANEPQPPGPALPSHRPATVSCASLPMPASITRSRSGARTFRTRSSKAGGRLAAATLSAQAGSNCLCPKAAWQPWC
jgi:hypothetical protein